MKSIRKLLKTAYIWSPPLLWMAFIYSMSSQPASNLPRHWLLQHDKIIHAGVFAVLALTLYRALLLQWPKQPALRLALLTTLLCTAYGAYDEYHQTSSTGRIADIQDWYADLLGSTASILATPPLLWWRKRKKT